MLMVGCPIARLLADRCNLLELIKSIFSPTFIMNGFCCINIGSISWVVTVKIKWCLPWFGYVAIYPCYQRADWYGVGVKVYDFFFTI